MDNYSLVYKKYDAMMYRGMLDDCHTVEEIAGAIFPQIAHFDITPQEVLEEVEKIFAESNKAS